MSVMLSASHPKRPIAMMVSRLIEEGASFSVLRGWFEVEFIARLRESVG
jgi:hypothetical protein